MARAAPASKRKRPLPTVVWAAPRAWARSYTSGATAAISGSPISKMSTSVSGRSPNMVDRLPCAQASPAITAPARPRTAPSRPSAAAVAAVIALKYPFVGLGICICCLVVYLRPDPRGAEKKKSRSASR